MGLLKIFGLQRISDVNKSMLPHPNTKFDLDDWDQHRHDHNLDLGVTKLGAIGELSIYDDGRGQELALDIKRKFVSNYTKKLTESIKINVSKKDGFDFITVSLKPTENG